MQIVDFNRHDLAELVKFYNDSSYKVYGYAGWGTGGALGINFPAAAARPSGGA